MRVPDIRDTSLQHSSKLRDVMPTTPKKTKNKRLCGHKGMFAAHAKIDAQEDLSTAGTQIESAASALWGLLNDSGPEEQDDSQAYVTNKMPGANQPLTLTHLMTLTNRCQNRMITLTLLLRVMTLGQMAGPSISAAAIVPIDMTLQLVSQLRTGTTSGDELELFINAVDMYKFENSPVKLVTTRPRALTMLPPALQAKDPKLNQLINELTEIISTASITGKTLAGYLTKFVADFTTLYRAQSPAAILGLLVIAGQFRTKKYKRENIAAFHFSRKILRLVRHHCSIADNKIEKFIRAARKGHLRGENLPVLNSPGYARMQETDHVKLTWHLHNLFEALNYYISYEAVKTTSAEKATLKLEIDGPNHELSMTEAETAEQYPESGRTL